MSGNQQQQLGDPDEDEPGYPDIREHILRDLRQFQAQHLGPVEIHMRSDWFGVYQEPSTMWGVRVVECNDPLMWCYEIRRGCDSCGSTGIVDDCIRGKHPCPYGCPEHGLQECRPFCTEPGSSERCDECPEERLQANCTQDCNGEACHMTPECFTERTVSVDNTDPNPHLEGMP